MNLAEIIKVNADKFSTIPGAQDIEKIISACKELGYNVLANSEKEPEFIPMARFNELTGQKNEYKTQVGELNKQLEELKKVAGSSEELQKQIQTLQDQIAKGGEKQKQSTINYAAKLAAITAKAKDPEDVLRFLDMSKVAVGEDDAVTGIEEQLKSLAEGKPYLFDTAGGNVGGGSNPAGGGGNQTPTFTREQLKTMTPDQINANWSAISEQMAAGKL